MTEKRPKKILVLCPYPEKVAPSQRLKFEQYYSYFRQSGYEVTISPFVSLSFWKIIYKKGNFFFKAVYTLQGYFRRCRDLFRLRKYDIVYTHLWVTPFGAPFFEWMVIKLSKKVIYDIDDLIFLKNTSGTKLIDLLKGKRKPVLLIKKANHVITCTPYLTEYSLKLNKNTTDISSTIDTDVYIKKNDYFLKKNELVLGWSGSQSTSKYLLLLAPALLELKKKINFRLIVMGDGNFTIPGIEIEALPWKESYETEVIRKFDIGLYPLPDEQWVYGKSGLKALQYMATGVPTIATAIGANFRVIENGVSGFLVTTPAEWVEKIILLAGSEELRRNIGDKARRRVEDMYSVKATAPVYCSILEELTNR